MCMTFITCVKLHVYVSMCCVQAVLSGIRRGHWIPWDWSYVVFSHHIGSEKRSLVLCKSSLCSESLSHLSNPSILLVTFVFIWCIHMRVCVCVWNRACVHTHDDMHMEAREKLQEPVLSFHRVNHSAKTRVFRFGDTAFNHGAISPVLYHFVFFVPARSEQIFKLVKKGLMRWKRAKGGVLWGRWTGSEYIIHVWKCHSETSYYV